MIPKILCEHSDGRCVLQAVLGDLTTELVDVIVNAANSDLLHGGGLAGAIVDRGGPSIQEESDLVAPVAVGGAVATTAGDLPARWVIHAVGPIWGSGDEENLLRSAVRSSLDLAAGLGAGIVGLPAISTGIFGYPKPLGTKVIVDECRRWRARNAETPVMRIRCTAFDETTAGLFADAIRGLSD